MKSLARLLLIMLLIGNLLMVTAVSMHVIRTPARLEFIPKSQLTLVETYVDTRNWTVVDLKNHAAFVQRLAQDGRQDVLSHVTTVNASSHSSNSIAPPPKDLTGPEPRSKNIFDLSGQN